ncbi:MAG: ABC transporter permease [Cyclobacteriaceae bacterium]|nr:ABC transporter permease [Cyclobacteriaceae bacterium]
MLYNYLKIALRNLQRNSIYSFINITGLAVGIASSVLIFLWVFNERTYDQFHTNHERLGQIWVHNEFSDNIATYNSVPLPLYEFLKTYDARIKNTSLAYWSYEQLLTVGETKIRQEGQFATPEFLEMFQFPFVKGSAAALKDPSSLIITESLATTLFGDAEAMNKSVLLDNTYELKIGGILKDLPQNSSFQFKFLAPWSIFAQQDWIKSKQDAWDDQSFPIYVELQEGANLAEVNAGIKNIIRDKVPDEKVDVFIHPLKEWHLRSQFQDGKQTGGMNDYVTGFTFIAIFILVIACINFMNLATARSEHRAREVGIRKSIGSRRRELIWQFIGESVLITAVAFVFALVLVELALPLFNNLVGNTLTIQYTSPIMWVLALAFIISTGFFAGSYPALYLSSFNPASVLKGKPNTGRKALAPRKFLVSLQFFFSICLIVSMVVIYKQIEFVKARNTGYNRDGLVMITNNEELDKNYTTLHEKLLASGYVTAVTTSSSPITSIYGNNTLDWPGKPADREILFSRVFIGDNYTTTMGITMAEGRSFSQAFKSDTAAMILNQAAVDVMGLENPVGTTVTLWSRKWTVVGVMNDVLMTSPFRNIQPGFFLYGPKGETITLRLSEAHTTAAALQGIEPIFKALNPAFPFEYEFVDQTFQRKFAGINMIGVLASVFAGLAILITCLGLLGLATFTAEQRTKEIGIRKVLGATNLNIVTLISKDFTRLVLFGFVFAAPVTWYGLNYWLEKSYSYRIGIAWWIIPAAGMVAMGLTLLIVAAQALRAAASNPSESLRTE